MKISSLILEINRFSDLQVAVGRLAAGLQKGPDYNLQIAFIPSLSCIWRGAYLINSSARRSLIRSPPMSPRNRCLAAIWSPIAG